jgi:hypothetical protein
MISALSSTISVLRERVYRKELFASQDSGYNSPDFNNLTSATALFPMSDARVQASRLPFHRSGIEEFGQQFGG